MGQRIGALLFGRTNADVIFFHGDDATIQEVVTVPGNRAADHPDLPMDGFSDEAKHAGMRTPMVHDQIAEILVQRYEHPLIAVRIGQNGTIARIARPVVHRLDIVTV